MCKPGGQSISHKSLTFSQSTFVLAASTWYTSYTCESVDRVVGRPADSILGARLAILVGIPPPGVDQYSPDKIVHSMRHPHVRDIVDIALQLTGGNRLAGEATAIMLILNNVFLAGFHVLTGSKVGRAARCAGHP